LNVFLISFVCAQYGSPSDYSNTGYGGTYNSEPSGAYNSEPSGDYGHIGQNSVGDAGGSDGNSEVNSMFTYIHIIF